MSAAVFRRAADAMAAKGHVRCLFVDVDGRMCLAGAVQFAHHGDPLRWNAESDALVGDVAELLGFERYYEAIAWNNEPDRKPSDVIAALDAAYIVALQEEGLEPGDVLR